MCRRNQLLSYIILGFGLGLLIGQCFQSGFLCTCGGIVIIVIGFCGIRNK